MTDPDLISRLQGMQKDFTEAPIPTGNRDSIDDIDDGDYQGIVQAFDIFDGVKDPSAVYLKIITSIQNDSKYGGREVSFLHNLMDPERMQWLKKDLATLGVDVENLDYSQLHPGSPLLESLLDAKILLGIYTNKKKNYKNAVIRQRLDGSDFGTAQEQIAGFEGRSEVPTDSNPKGKPKNCICPDPSNGEFDRKCPVPGHFDDDIPF